MPFDVTSKTTWAMAVASLAALLGLIGVTINEDQMSSLTTAATYLAQAISLLAPVVGAIYHQIAKRKAQTALMNAGLSHDDAKAATKS